MTNFISRFDEERNFELGREDMEFRAMHVDADAEAYLLAEERRSRPQPCSDRSAVCVAVRRWNINACWYPTGRAECNPDNIPF